MESWFKGLMTPFGKPVFLITEGSFVRVLIHLIVRNIGEEINRKGVARVATYIRPVCAQWLR